MRNKRLFMLLRVWNFLSGSVFVFCHIDSIFRSNTALLFYWVCSRFMTRFWKHKKSFAACYRADHYTLAAIIQTFVHYKLNILWTLFVARLHCKFSKVSMFEYNFNFVKTFLIWCFQDFTKSKFIQMNFIYLKHEFSNILRCCANSRDIYYYSRYFLCLKKYPTLTLLRYIFRESCKSSLQSKDIPNSFFVFLTNFYILYFPKT